MNKRLQSFVSLCPTVVQTLEQTPTPGSTNRMDALCQGPSPESACVPLDLCVSLWCFIFMYIYSRYFSKSHFTLCVAVANYVFIFSLCLYFTLDVPFAVIYAIYKYI